MGIPIFDLQEFGEHLTDEELAIAACNGYDPDSWFPGSGRGAGRIAKKVCMSCPIRVRCLDVAMANDEPYGVWGGLNQHDRRRLRRKLNEQHRKNAEGSE